jgi:hypothetical protein
MIHLPRRSDGCITLAAQATPMDEATRTGFIGGAMKACLAEINNDENVKRAFSQAELSNYCGCFSATLANTSTQEDVTYYYVNHSYPSGYYERASKPAANYCLKYLTLPDVSGIKNKNW